MFTLDDIDAEYDDVVKPEICSTGILGLDMALGGGFLRRRIVEVLGTEGSGKSTVAYCAAAAAQDAGGDVAWIESAATTFMPHYAEGCGVQMNKLSVITPNVEIERVLALVEEVVASGVFHTVILEDLQRGMRAQSSAWQKLSKEETHRLSVATARGTTLLLTTNTDQKWLVSHPFWIAQRLVMSAKSATKLEATVLVSPIGQPGAKVTIPVVLERGVDHARHLLQVAEQHHLIQEKHGYYSYQGESLGHGVQAAATTLIQRQGLRDALTRTLTALVA